MDMLAPYLQAPTSPTHSSLATTGGSARGPGGGAALQPLVPRVTLHPTRSRAHTGGGGGHTLDSSPRAAGGGGSPGARGNGARVRSPPRASRSAAAAAADASDAGPPQPQPQPPHALRASTDLPFLALATEDPLPSGSSRSASPGPPGPPAAQDRMAPPSTSAPLNAPVRVLAAQPQEQPSTSLMPLPELRPIRLGSVAVGGMTRASGGLALDPTEDSEPPSPFGSRPPSVMSHSHASGHGYMAMSRAQAAAPPRGPLHAVLPLPAPAAGGADGAQAAPCGVSPTATATATVTATAMAADAPQSPPAAAAAAGMVFQPLAPASPKHAQRPRLPPGSGGGSSRGMPMAAAPRGHGSPHGSFSGDVRACGGRGAGVGLSVGPALTLGLGVGRAGQHGSMRSRAPSGTADGSADISGFHDPSACYPNPSAADAADATDAAACVPDADAGTDTGAGWRMPCGPGRSSGSMTVALPAFRPRSVLTPQGIRGHQ